MKRTICIALACLLSISINGCRTAADRDAPSSPKLLQKRTEAIRTAGGIAALGVAKSTPLSSALDKSLLDAQTKLAMLVTSKIDALRDNLKAEIGEENISPFNELFQTAKDTLVKKELNDIIPADIKYETIGGVTTAYSLLIIDPNVIATAFPSDSKYLKHIYTRFRASRAFAQMKKENRQYEMWKKHLDSSDTDL